MQQKHYTKKSEVTSGLLPEYKIYTNCHDLPLYNFLKILTEDNLSYLVISGNPPEHVLSDSWEIIFNEYSDLYHDKQKSYILEIIKEITVYNLNINLVEKVVNVMSVNPHEDLAGILRSMGFVFSYDPSNLERYQKDLSLTISKAKSMIIKLDTAKKELDAMKPKGNGKVNYDAVLVTLGKYQGYRIDPKNTPVSEYIEVFNSYNRLIEAEQSRASIPG